jgi:UPF0271 protein
MLINCAVAERGVANVIDDAILPLIDIATIACGAHAGDEASIKYYQELTAKHGVRAAAYLSYPNQNVLPEGKSSLSHDEVMEALEEQALRFGPMKLVKFQGGLYGHLNRSAELAERVGNWLSEKGVEEVIAPYRSMLHKACIEQKIPVLYEAYGDRHYNDMNVGLELMPHDQLGALLENIDDVLKQVRKLKMGVIVVDGQNFLMEAETVCIDTYAADAIDKLHAIKKIL